MKVQQTEFPPKFQPYKFEVIIETESDERLFAAFFGYRNRIATKIKEEVDKEGIMLHQISEKEIHDKLMVLGGLCYRKGMWGD